MSEKKKTEKKKSFADYQPEGVLKGTFFDYIPDAFQVGDWLKDTLSRDGSPKGNIDGAAKKGRTKGNKR